MPIHTRPGTWEYCIMKTRTAGNVSLQSPQNAASSHLSPRRTGSADPDRSENERAGRRQIEEAALLRVPEAPAGKQPHAHSQHRNGSRNTPAGSYLQPAFSAAHLRLVSPTARPPSRIRTDSPRPPSSRPTGVSLRLSIPAETRRRMRRDAADFTNRLTEREGRT